jgi:hypothetical protein
MPEILERWKVMPHGPLVEVGSGILTVAGDIPMPLGNFPRRMTVVGLKGGRTAIYSAIALRDEEMARIEDLGRPSVLVVPSGAHRLDSKIWKSRYPALKVLAPPGALEKVEEAVSVDATASILDDPSVRFDVVGGTGGQEAALMVRREDGATLICNDIIGHVTHPHGLGANIMARLMGFGVEQPQVPRVIRHRVIADDQALAAQLRAWAAEPGLNRIIVSHGEPITDDPAGALIKLAQSLEG